MDCSFAFGNLYTEVFEPEVDIYAFMHDRCQDGVRMCTLRPRASAQWLVRGRVSGFQNMRTTHRHIYIYNWYLMLTCRRLKKVLWRENFSCSLFLSVRSVMSPEGYIPYDTIGDGGSTAL